MTTPQHASSNSSEITPTRARSVFFQGQEIEAVLFDVDGTLYSQKPLRLRMAAELAGLPLTTWPRKALRTIRVLSAFRDLRETIRDHEARNVSANGRPRARLEKLQYEVTASHTGESVEFVREVVRQWIFERPLRHLRSRPRKGLVSLLDELRARTVHVGVFSDYPVWAKLQALGLSDYVDVAVSATERDVDAFKPDPRGFLVACERWNLAPERVLYVGDRAEVDAVGARAAGMPCAIIGAAASSTEHSDHSNHSSYSSYNALKADLHDAL